jgi:hypothetical protein
MSRKMMSGEKSKCIVEIEKVAQDSMIQDDFATTRLTQTQRRYDSESITTPAQMSIFLYQGSSTSSTSSASPHP